MVAHFLNVADQLRIFFLTEKYGVPNMASYDMSCNDMSSRVIYAAAH